MALTLQIKRSSGSTAPSSLADGELAYTHGNEKFYIGDGSTVKVIGGKAYNDLIDHTAGTLTASSAVIVDQFKRIDDFYIGNDASTGGSLKLNEGTTNGSNYVALKAPNSVGANVTFTLPSADGSTGQFLKTNGSGTLSFADAVTAEAVEDITAAQLVTNGSHTRLSATYDDANDGAIDLVVDSDLSNYSNANSGFATLTGTETLTNKTLTSPEISSIINTGTLTLPTASGTVALTSDIPTNNNQLTNGSGYITASSTTTLTNKTFDANGTGNSISNIEVADLAAAAIQLSSESFVDNDTTLMTAAAIEDRITGKGYLTSYTETDTLDSVTGRGASTNNSITVGEIDIDNINVINNTISTTNSNGDLVLAPDGTGTVTVPSGYEGRGGFGSDSLVNKSYVDSVANGLDVKASVRVATTANLSATYSSGVLTASSNGAIAIDGVNPLSVGDRVLVKDQTTAAHNGFYEVTTVGSGSAAFVLTRTPDADAASELTPGAFTFVEEGTANADNGYVHTTNGTITLGTTSITFEQFSGAGQIDAGNGLTKSGNTINAVGTADKISVSANAITIASTYVGQSSITTLGTITTGTWNGTTIGVAYGGTGLTSAAKGSVLVANTANTFSALDGGGANDGLLLYTASNDTISWATSIDGGTF